jgi:hypothetical protein
MLENVKSTLGSAESSAGALIHGVMDDVKSNWNTAWNSNASTHDRLVAGATFAGEAVAGAVLAGGLAYGTARLGGLLGALGREATETSLLGGRYEIPSLAKGLSGDVIAYPRNTLGAGTTPLNYRLTSGYDQTFQRLFRSPQITADAARIDDSAPSVYDEVYRRFIEK